MSYTAHLSDIQHILDAPISQEKFTPPRKETIALIRNMPGRPPRNMILAHLMNTLKLTRAQAKDKLNLNDIYLAAQYERELSSRVAGGAEGFKEIFDAIRVTEK